MNYSTSDLVAKTGYSNSTIIKVLTNFGLEPVSIENHGLKMWEEKSLQILLDYKNRIIEETTLDISYLARKFNTNNQTIREILHQNNIKPLYFKERSQEVYPMESREVLKLHFDAMKLDDESQHPLITDKRCLRLGWFPDTVPKCFEDLDN